jgi:hypothetical protein
MYALFIEIGGDIHVVTVDGAPLCATRAEAEARRRPEHINPQVARVEVLSDRFVLRDQLKPLGSSFVYAGDARERYGGVWWIFEHEETGFLIGVQNVQYEHDPEGGSGWTWERIAWSLSLEPFEPLPLDGDACDALHDVLYEAVRDTAQR